MVNRVITNVKIEKMSRKSKNDVKNSKNLMEILTKRPALQTYSYNCENVLSSIDNKFAISSTSIFEKKHLANLSLSLVRITII